MAVTPPSRAPAREHGLPVFQPSANLFREDHCAIQPSAKPFRDARGSQLQASGSASHRFPALGVSALPAFVPVLFLALPVLGLLARATTTGGSWAAMQRPVVLDALRLSLRSTTVVLVLTLLFGAPLALLLARRRFPGVTLAIR